MAQQSQNERPYWSQALRALRDARGITQDGWAAQLGYGRATVRRWEAGETVPSADAESAIINLCREKDLFRSFTDGPLAGVHVTPEWIAHLLASARLGEREPQPQIPAAGASSPPVRYAMSGEVAIAYQVFGDGPVDLIVTPGAVSHREIDWEYPGAREFFDRLAASARVIIFDKRGTGMSDRVEAGTLEQRVDDIRAVMDAEGSDRAVLFGISEGGPMSVLFAATYPERTRSLILYGAYANEPIQNIPPAQMQQRLDRLRQTWGRTGSRFLEIYGPSVATDPSHRDWWARYQRMSASPGSVIALVHMNLEIDVRHVLGAIRVPTMVLHRTGDRAVEIERGRDLASRIPNARFVEIPGEDHLPWIGDIETLTAAVTDFIASNSTVPAVDTVLASILVAKFDPGPEQSGQDQAEWHASIRNELSRFRGIEYQLDDRTLLASFDGPSRAVRCAIAIRDSGKTCGYRTRTGVHTAEVEIHPTAIAGDAVDLCTDLAGQASCGEILVTRTVTDLVAGSGLTFTRCEGKSARARSGEWQLYAVHDPER